MATGPVKSRLLHNFSLPFLKWGGKNHTNSNHRCRRPISGDSDHNSEPETQLQRITSRSSRNRFALSSCYLGEKSEKQQQQQQQEEEEEEEEEDDGERKCETDETVQKPWNLRPRKPVLSVEMGVGGWRNGELQETVTTVGGEIERKKKRKFWIGLSKEEIEEDIFIMTGSRPARRPKKRPKLVQKQLDNVFPGLWLVGLTADSYRLPDTPPKR